MLSFCLALLVSVPASAIDVQAESRISSSFLRKIQYHRVLRVCNAYPHSSALDVSIDNTTLTREPLQYKRCSDFTPELDGVQAVDFKIKDALVGTFTISELPLGDAMLVMVVHRHDTSSTSVAFTSHTFAPQTLPQIAIMDTYKGATQGNVRIQDAATTNQSELLRYDSVVAVDPGHYKVGLKNPHTSANLTAITPLVALPHHNYVVLRCGVEAQEGLAFPQELVVFPQFDAKELSSTTSCSILGFLGLATSWLLSSV